MVGFSQISSFLSSGGPESPLGTCSQVLRSTSVDL